MNRLLVSIVTVGLVWVTATGVASADKMSELKAVTDQAVAARNALDAAKRCALLHDNATELGPNAMFPISGKKRLCASMAAAWAGLQSFRLQRFNTKYQVVDNTGYVVGHVRVVVRPKGGGRPIIRHNYYSSTYVYMKDGWKQLGLHIRRLD